MAVSKKRKRPKRPRVSERTPEQVEQYELERRKNISKAKSGKRVLTRISRTDVEQIEAVIDTISSAIRRGLSNKSAAIVAGLTIDNFYNWQRFARHGQEPYTSLWYKVEKAKQEGKLMLANHVYVAAERDWKAAAWLLERRAKEFQRPDHSAPSTTNIQNNLIEESTKKVNERLERLRKLREKYLEEMAE